MESIEKNISYKEMKLNQIHPDYDSNTNPTPYTDEVELELDVALSPDDVPYNRVSSSADGAKSGDFAKISPDAQQWWNEEGTHLEYGEKDYGDGVKLIYKVNDETGEKVAMGFVKEEDVNAKRETLEAIKQQSRNEVNEDYVKKCKRITQEEKKLKEIEMHVKNNKQLIQQ